MAPWEETGFHPSGTGLPKDWTLCKQRDCRESTEGRIPPLRDRLFSFKKSEPHSWHVPTPSHRAGPRCHLGLTKRKFQHQLALADTPKSFKNKTQAMVIRMEREAFPGQACGRPELSACLPSVWFRNTPEPRWGPCPRLSSWKAECVLLRPGVRQAFLSSIKWLRPSLCTWMDGYYF